MSARLVVYTLCRREVVRFVRQRSRLVGALAQPVLFWLLLGGGLSASFRPAGEAAGTKYLEYFYPGIIALTLLFTAIFSTISVVEDRKAGFLQGVLVAPVSRWSIVMGQAAGATTLAAFQGGLLLLLAPLAGLTLSLKVVAATFAVMIPLAFSMTGLGLMLAWRMDSTQGFHAIMNLVLMPMWLLSGAFFPAAGAPAWLGWAMKLNPMTYGMTALREALGKGRPDPVSLMVVVVFGVLAFAGAVRLAKR